MTALTIDPLTLAYHELRSPLGLMATAARSLAEESIDDAVRGRCELIARSVERMLRTTSRVLELARGAPAEAAVRFAPAEVAAALAGDLARFDARIAVRSTDAARAWTVETQRGAFETLIQSLLSNAIDHSDPGDPIHVAMDATDDGFSLEIVNRIAAKKRHTGLGAGLYLCSRLAEQIGASLRAEADGSLYRATVRLPSCE